MKKRVLGWFVGLAAASGGIVYLLGNSQLGALAEPGTEIGDLQARDQEGRLVSLGSLRGRPVVVFFYPRDETPGCTKEACAFRDAFDAYERAGIAVVGVSGGSTAGKKRFADKHDLPFPIVSDEGLLWARAFGVRVILGVPSRVSFLLGPDGKLHKSYPEVDPGVHAEQVLADAAALVAKNAQAAN